MTFASGGLIQASDYNGFVGADPTTTAGTLNRVWGIGNNDAGYGQTAVAQVSAGNTVTAAQWASLINNLNNAYKHSISTAGTGLSAPTAGSRILFISTLAGYLTDIYNNRLNDTGNGTSTTFSSSYAQSAAGGTASTASATRTVTFSSVDACRYFWNAGGEITFDVTSVTNNDGTSRSASIVTLANTNFNAKTVKARSANARTGSGGAAVTDITASGFYNLVTTYTTFFNATGQTYPYTGDSCTYRLLTNGTAGSYSGNGNIITLYFETISGSTGTSTPTSDAMNVTVNYTITVLYPETTYLTNSWGTATIA